MPQSVYSRFGTPASSGVTSTTRQHVVVAGETLPSIAALEYNTGYDSELWRQIAEANSIDDVDALTVNTTLVIPAPRPPTT